MHFFKFLLLILNSPEKKATSQHAIMSEERPNTFHNDDAVLLAGC